MFCTSLRRRPSISQLIPFLQSAQALQLKEGDLKSYDLCLPLQHNGHKCKPDQLHVLLLTRSDGSSDRLDKTIARVERFHGLTGGRNALVIFLLFANCVPTRRSVATVRPSGLEHEADQSTISQETYEAYQSITDAILDQAAQLLDLSVIPVTGPTHLKDLILTHVERLSSASAGQLAGFLKPGISARSLIQNCTVNPPLKREAVDLIMKAWPNLAEFARACGETKPGMTDIRRSPELDQLAASVSHGESLLGLYDLLPEEAVDDVLAFWREEYISEPYHQEI